MQEELFTIDGKTIAFKDSTGKDCFITMNVVNDKPQMFITTFTPELFSIAALIGLLISKESCVQKAINTLESLPDLSAEQNPFWGDQPGKTSKKFYKNPIEQICIYSLYLLIN